MSETFDPEKIYFQGKEFGSVDELLLHLAEITGRLDRDLNKQRLSLSNGATWNEAIGGGKQKDYSTTASTPGRTSVYFKGLENKLASLIQEADVVIGCVAWLSSKRILKALTNKIAVSLIVQKEDFLRPDSVNISMEEQRRLYRGLPGLYRSNKATAEAAALMTNTQESEATPIEGVRCVGFKRSIKRVEPNMHHKFVVLCRYTPDSHPYSIGWNQYGLIEPYGVWTGSFNFTYNGTRSLENAVYMEDKRLAEAYFSEWGQVATLSEPLDWTEDRSGPNNSTDPLDESARLSERGKYEKAKAESLGGVQGESSLGSG